MHRDVVITDLTRMGVPRVCVAGYVLEGNEAYECIRPELRRNALSEAWLRTPTGVIRPFSVVRLDLLEHKPEPPHTEDWMVAGGHRVLKERITAAEQWSLLVQLDDGAIADIFGTPLIGAPGAYVRIGTGHRSLGTVFPEHVSHVVYRIRDDTGAWDYRLRFTDCAGTVFDLAVTDLAFRLYADQLRQERGMAAHEVARSLYDAIAGSKSVALRVGLARRWSKHPDRCHLQVNGIYTEPDYLSGQCWADLLPSPLKPQVRLEDIDVPF